MLEEGREYYESARRRVAMVRGAMKSATASPSIRYLDDLAQLKCGPDMLALKLFPNAKEVTESFGAYSAAARYMRRDLPLSDRSVTMVAVGDGRTPRTAATFAYRSAWKCYSVDPMLKANWHHSHGVDRLTCLPIMAEQVEPIRCEQAVVVAVHSHASLPAAVRTVRPSSGVVNVIAMPCCVEQWLDGCEPDVVYADPSVWSPQCTVMVWRGVESAWKD